MKPIFSVGVVFFVLGAWQMSRRGPYARLVGVSLVIAVVSAALSLAGKDQLGAAVMYEFAACFVLLQLLWLSDSRKFYFHLVPFAVIYGAAVGWVSNSSVFSPISGGSSP